jgi:hypothetical protein
MAHFHQPETAINDGYGLYIYLYIWKNCGTNISLFVFFLNSREWEEGGNYGPYYLGDHKLSLALLNYFEKSVTPYPKTNATGSIFRVYCR